MKIFEHYTDIPEESQGAVVVIGNFDGVHRGHQALLKQGRIIANELQKPLAVLTFEPHPVRLFRPDEPPNRITPRAIKNQRLKEEGIDLLFSIPFTWDFASQNADGFVQKVLIDGLNTAHVIVGFDFKFGQLRQGTPETIKESGLPVTIIEEIQNDKGEVFSSSRIRQFLRHGKIDEANEILGWNWEIRGTIFRGDQRGRELGYPTANMALDDAIHPAYGVYAVLARLDGEKHWMMGATNIGIRPMFEIPSAQVETFIFDFDREIYDQVLHVRPVRRLRGEAKFDSLEALKAQMKKDCDQAKEILKDALKTAA